MRQQYSETGKCLLTWHGNGTLTKELVSDVALSAEIRERFSYERRINRMLSTDPPPVGFALLVDTGVTGDAMRFRAIDGDPLGPKWGATLSDPMLATLAESATQLQSYGPTAAWIRRYDPDTELHRRRAEAVIDDDEFSRVNRVIQGREWRASFAHGDFTPRNILSAPDGPVLIDWEFAGWHPLEYDRAFLWMVLGDTPDSRALLESTVPGDRSASFWLCAYLIQLYHLGMWAQRPEVEAVLPRHMATKRRALEELLTREAPT